MKIILALAIAVFFVLSLATIAFAEENFYSLSGSIMAVDPGAKTLTLKSDESPLASAQRWQGDVTIATDEMTNVMMCSENKSLEDLRVGEHVSLRYHEIDGFHPIADQIAVTEQC